MCSPEPIMSLVSSPGLLNGNSHGQLNGPATSQECKQKDEHFYEQDGQGNVQSPASEALVNSSYQTSTDNNSLPNEDHTLDADLPVIDIIINNVVCTFSTRCYLNLKKIATEGVHVEYKRENGMLNMKLRRPNATATIWSSGKITCTGSTSEGEAKVAARRTARRLQKMGFSIRFSSYRVVNVLGTCSLPFGIKLNQFSEEHRVNASYEPELHPGVTYRIKDPKATLKIFSTGSITVTAPSVENVQLAIEHIYPLVVVHKMEARHIKQKILAAEKKYLEGRRTFVGYHVPGFIGDGVSDIGEHDDDELADDLSDSFDSDVSQD